MAKPGLLNIRDIEGERAEQTHIKFIQVYADEPVLVLGIHISNTDNG